MLGYFLDEYRKTEHGEKSLIIVTADHGNGIEQIGQKGNTTFSTINGNHIPLLILFPTDYKISKKTIKYLGGQQDIMPTVMDIMRIKEDFPVFGKSLIRDYKYRYTKLGVKGVSNWLLTGQKFFRMFPKKSLFDLNWKELEINEEDRKWFDLSIEIDQIQQWIIRQKNVNEVRTRLYHQGWSG